ncbi:SGNH/GDSL hydrolase family protein [Flagellimonas allohymeniacidonis]|uniref:G-D-S-L family lipolytic protein n=1 Tax=Flagellimonas allohymeniacidonis TaxID=2517819 RepID=A0A4Q8QFZ4_9FLAO|nr:SGNH/GDSL hydrolase family protein [Allomuricauda hymeniacidonis]TAI49381.1 G-D-S-L family lipolytic protein [Allomuricauda hymeniacidonis]
MWRGFKLACLVVVLCISSSTAQKKLAFEEEVKDIQKKMDTLWDASKETIVFTGSSSIRLWEDLQERFPEQQVLNTGFGGSQSSDLVNFLDELILDYNPVKVFIYEGDNDIFAKKRPKAIIETFNSILNKLQKARPQMEIALISAKPSISRWHYRGRYRRLNRKLSKIAEEREEVSFIDVWHIMLNKRRLKKDLFIEDGLHMNPKGYELWYITIKDYIPTEAK